MKKPISLPLPKCKKCKKTLDPRFTTEKAEGDNTKPEIIIMYGQCNSCRIITVCNLIKTKDIPTEKDLVHLIKQGLKNGR